MHCLRITCLRMPDKVAPLLRRLAATIVCVSAQIQMSLPRWSRAAVYGRRTGSAPRLPLLPMAQQKPHFASLLARDTTSCCWPAYQRPNHDVIMALSYGAQTGTGLCRLSPAPAGM